MNGTRDRHLLRLTYPSLSPSTAARGRAYHSWFGRSSELECLSVVILSGSHTASSIVFPLWTYALQSQCAAPRPHRCGSWMPRRAQTAPSDHSRQVRFGPARRLVSHWRTFRPWGLRVCIHPCAGPGHCTRPPSDHRIQACLPFRGASTPFCGVHLLILELEHVRGYQPPTLLCPTTVPRRTDPQPADTAKRHLDTKRAVRTFKSGTRHSWRSEDPPPMVRLDLLVVRSSVGREECITYF